MKIVRQKTLGVHRKFTVSLVFKIMDLLTRAGEFPARAEQREKEIDSTHTAVKSIFGEKLARGGIFSENEYVSGRIDCERD